MKFHFAAESVLRLKNSELQQAKNRCREIQFQIDKCRADEKQIQHELTTYTESIHDQGRGFVDRNYIGQVFTRLQQLAQQLDQLQIELKSATQISVALYQETETLLQLKADQKKAFQQTVARRELATQTDTVMHRRRRRPAS